MKNHAFCNAPVMTIVFPVLLTVTGCGSQPDATNEQPTTQAASQVIFEEPYSATGRFRIIRFATGKLAVSVTGAIGKDDPKEVGKLLSHSVVKMYRALRPDQPVVPEILTALDERLSAVPKVDRPKPSAPPVSAFPGEIDDIPECFDTVCHTFYSGVCGTPAHCVCGNGPQGISSVCIPSYINVTYYPEDYSFYYNDSPSAGNHWLTGFPESVIYVGDGWGYNRWEDYFGKPCLALWSGGGTLGVTVHKPTCD